MALLISSVVLFLLAHLIPSPIGSTADLAANQTITARWTSDLRPAIGGDPLGLVPGRKREWQAKPRTSLWFLDDGTIIATYVTKEEGHPVLSGRSGSDPNQPLRLRAIFLDADTGKVTSTQVWPSESRYAGIVATNEGTFVTQRGTTLTLYSSDAKELGKLSLPPLPEDVGGWRAHPSPTGNSILFSTGDLMATSAKPWIWVDGKDLRIARSWKEVQSGPMEISDSAIAMTACYYWQYHCGPVVAIRGLATEWKTIAAVEKQFQWGGVRFVNDDTLFLSGTPWKLLQSDGKVILSEDAPFEGGTAVVSAGGKRFVVPFFKSKGGFAALDIGAHGELNTISVYDAPFRERSYLLAVKGPKIKSASDKSVAQLALSPDGSKLAILYEESVYLFQLPPLK
jgi:hypothetical protein